MCSSPLRLFLLLRLVLSVLPAAVRQYEFKFETRENVPVRTQVGDLKRLNDGTPSRLLPSDLQDANMYNPNPSCRDLFVIDAKAVVVVVKTRPDRESICPPSFSSSSSCVCTLSVITRNNVVIKINVTILDVNDHTPSFSSSVKFLSISESAAEGYEQSLDPAEDADLLFSVTRYTLARTGPGTEDVRSTFGVRYEKASSELKLHLKAPLDYERVKQYNATLDACDDGVPSKCGSQLLVISVRDENDNSPVFPQARIEASVAENVTTGHVVVRVAATDRDSGENGRLVYRKKTLAGLGRGGSAAGGVMPDESHYFGVNEETGDVYTQKKLVFDKAKAKVRVSLQIEASDHGNPVRKAVATVVIKILDVNNHSPTILLKPKDGHQRCEILEDAPKNSTVAHLIVSDNDDPASAGGRFHCRLTDGRNRFHLTFLSSSPSQTFYRLLTAVVFDREKEDLVPVRIVCTDEGGLQSTKDIPVNILDRNEFKPSFDGTPYEARVRENGPPNMLVLQVRASDRDSTARLLYSIDRHGSEFFRMEPETGELFTKRRLDREKVPALRFEVTVTDAVGNGLRHIGRANVTVLVEDVNDNRPTVSKPLHFTVDENTPDDTNPAASVSVGRLHAIDPDDGRNGEVHFRLVGVRVPQPRGLDNPPPPPPPNGTFELRQDGVLFLMRQLDREKHEQLLLDVQVADGGSPQRSTSCTVSITVRDANDNPPAWKHPTTHENAKNISSLAQPGYVVTRVRAVDPDFDSVVRYSLVRGGRYFSVHDTEGEVRIRTTLTPGVYKLKFRASDNGRPKQSSDIEYVVRVYYQDPYPSAGTAGRYGMNLPLIVAMIAVTCIICVSLVIAIVVVRRKSGAAARHMRSGSAGDGFGSTDAADSTQKWVQEGVNGASTGGGPNSNMYSPGHAWMRPEIFSSATSPAAVSTNCYHGNSVDKYHATPVSQATGQPQMIRMHGLPVDMEVASADSGHGASEEEGLQAADQRNKEMRLCAQRTPCPILPEDSVVQCGCSSTPAAGISAAPTMAIAGTHPFGTLPLYDYTRTLDMRAGAMPMVGLNNTIGPSMSSFRNIPVLPPVRHGSVSSAGAVGGAMPERRPSQSNV